MIWSYMRIHEATFSVFSDFLYFCKALILLLIIPAEIFNHIYKHCNFSYLPMCETAKKCPPLASTEIIENIAAQTHLNWMHIKFMLYNNRYLADKNPAGAKRVSGIMYSWSKYCALMPKFRYLEQVHLYHIEIIYILRMKYWFAIFAVRRGKTVKAIFLWVKKNHEHKINIAPDYPSRGHIRSCTITIRHLLEKL